MNILQTIFKDHYEEMLYILHPRQAVIDNVDKMINCGDPLIWWGNVCLFQMWKPQICAFPL